METTLKNGESVALLKAGTINSILLWGILQFLYLPSFPIVVKNEVTGFIQG
jgi:hypothetical protein